MVGSVLLFSALLGWSEAGLLGIIGGDTTPIRNHPFQASITVDGEFVCSGSLIHPKWILTVASCAKGYDPEYMKVRLGSTKTDSEGEVYQVKRVISHEEFSARSMDYDIALVELTKPARMGPKVRTIRIAHDPVTQGEKLTVSGWGQDQNGTVGIYKKVNLNVAELIVCQETMTNELITPRMICTQTQENSPCFGDFGDPLVNPWKALVGLFSFTKECSKYPSVFTDVVSFRSWISDNVKDSNF